MSSPLPFFFLPLLPMTGNLPADIASSESHALPPTPVVLAAPADATPARRPAAAPVTAAIPVPATDAAPAPKLDCAATRKAAAAVPLPRIEPSAVIVSEADVQCFR